MTLLGRNQSYKAKISAPSPMPGTAPAQPALPGVAPQEAEETDAQAPTPAAPTSSIPQPSLAEVAAPDLSLKADNTPAWVKAGSYEELVKTNPNVSRGQYAYELSKYRREQGLPDLSYAEWGNIIRGQDPFETEEERQKREKNMRIANQINAVGSFINALVNYNRVKRGHVAYKPDTGTEMYNRLERMRLGQEQVARANAKNYLNLISLDRAERAKEAAAAAAAEQARKNYDIKIQELEWKKDNAKTEAERKKAEHDLKKAELDEAIRSNKENEKIARIRANKAGGSGGGGSEYKASTSAIGSDGSVLTRNTPLRKEEAIQLVMSNEMGKNPDFLEKHRAKVTTTNEEGETVKAGDIDWVAAASDLMANKKIPSSTLYSMGYKPYPNNAQQKVKTVEGF